MSGGEFRAVVDTQIKVHDAETGGSSGEPVDVVLLPEKDRVERGVDPIAGGIWQAQRRRRRFDQSVRRPRRGLRRRVRSRVPFGERFVLYQRNIENLCQDKATLREEIRKSVAELFNAALDPRTGIAIKGAPEHHAEAANLPEDEDG